VNGLDTEELDTETDTTSVSDSDTTPPATFRNPLNTIRGSDPFMLYYEGNYYLTATTWSNQLTMKRAPTIEGLKTAEEVVVWEERNLFSNHCCNMWAPEFYFLDGKWYYYYTAGRQGDNFDYQRMYVLESEGKDPMGPYTWRGQIYDVQSLWTIDGSILELEGDRYFMFSRWQGNKQCLFIARMSNPWTLTGGATTISCPEYSWEMRESNVNEGSEALQRNGKTFVVYSASGCMSIEYKLGLLELVENGNPMKADDWIKHPEPVFRWRQEDGRAVYGPGHNGIFKSPDGTEWWHVYHANSDRNGGCTVQRTTRAQKIDWNTDGTPDFGEPKFLNEDIVVPSGE
jgi:GH43 family beta-xylosidase